MLPKPKKSPAKGKHKPSPLKVFISYAHRDEKLKDELLTMLASLEHSGIIDVWQDRRIEEGDEWLQAIKNAMNECSLALLLVSPTFLASPFIQKVEIPRLLKRRMREGLRVVPIIIRQCLWKSDPILKKLQALPKDGKPVISFPKASGRRDQVWTEIAQEIEQRAK